MSRLTSVFCACLTLVALSGCVSGQEYGYDRPYGEQSVRILSVADIVALSDQGMPESQIIAIIQQNRVVYRLSYADMANLQARGVSPNVIEAMQGHYVQVAPSYPVVEYGSEPAVGVNSSIFIYQGGYSYDRPRYRRPPIDSRWDDHSHREHPRESRDDHQESRFLPSVGNDSRRDHNNDHRGEYRPGGGNEQNHAKPVNGQYDTPRFVAPMQRFPTQNVSSQPQPAPSPGTPTRGPRDADRPQSLFNTNDQRLR